MRMMKPYPQRSPIVASNKTCVLVGKIMTKSLLIFHLLFLLFFCLFIVASGQLCIYQFTVSKTCPVQSPNVLLQPLDAVFGGFTAANVKCKSKDNVFNNEEWNKTNTIDLNEYVQFSI